MQNRVLYDNDFSKYEYQIDTEIKYLIVTTIIYIDTVYQGMKLRKQVK